MTRECITAMLRSIRLKRPEDALFYMAWLRDNGVPRDRIVKQLVRAALRDNLNVGLMEEVATAGDKADLKKLVIALASSQKFWSVHEGRQLIQVICAIQDDYRFQKHSDAELLHRLDEAMNDEYRFAEAAQLVHEIQVRRMTFTMSPWPEMLDMLSVRARSTPVAPVVSLLRRHVAGDSQILEECLLFLAIAWLTTGMWGQDLDLCGDAFEVRVAVRLKEDLVLPEWTAEVDPRFAGSWDGYANIALMLERDGHVDPNAEGVLFLQRGREWRPVIRQEAGLYLVQSQKRPRHLYEVNLANLSCTCEDWLRRRHECKHIRWARVFAEKNLPFELAV